MFKTFQVTLSITSVTTNFAHSVSTRYREIKFDYILTFRYLFSLFDTYIEFKG